mmetsp:Transcript_4996/g.9656  ORF Transcript_4996/g.9656 Transcript_4996/m.9656 type:complete len:387 (-) Transcript_4996:1296-2456(-)
MDVLPSVAASSGAGTRGSADFSVVISASARPTGGSEHELSERSARLVHAVSVSQPVQSWTVIRDHIDFVALGNALSAIIHSLPACPSPPSPSSSGSEDVDKIVNARNALQEWLTAVLFVPGARENPAVRQFLCYGANIVPPQFEGVTWVSFSSSRDHPSGSSIVQVAVKSQQGGGVDGSPAPETLDEMEMDDMFGYEGADGEEGGDGGPDFDSDSEADYFSATIRYQPADEAITEDDIMEMQQQANEVEMVEDVGSLAQSLGASHLGRSLQLQAQHAGLKHGHNDHLSEKIQQKGLTVGGGVTEVDGSTGGIGGAMEQAQSGAVPSNQPPSKFDGLGDSFDQRAPISQPRLDSFKMIKVIGKGSFGKLLIPLRLRFSPSSSNIFPA